PGVVQRAGARRGSRGPRAHAEHARRAWLGCRIPSLPRGRPDLARAPIAVGFARARRRSNTYVILTTPVWSEHQPPHCPSAPRATLRVDTAVIGAGLTGLSAAHHLLRRRPGARLVVLEAGRIGAGASGRTTGLLGPGVGQSLMALVRRQGPARARLLYLATLRAVQDVCRLVRDEGIECELDMAGHLIVARSAA